MDLCALCQKYHNKLAVCAADYLNKVSLLFNLEVFDEGHPENSTVQCLHSFGVELFCCFQEMPSFDMLVVLYRAWTIFLSSFSRIYRPFLLHRH